MPVCSDAPSSIRLATFFAMATMQIGDLVPWHFAKRAARIPRKHRIWLTWMKLSP